MVRAFVDRLCLVGWQLEWPELDQQHLEWRHLVERGLGPMTARGRGAVRPGTPTWVTRIAGDEARLRQQGVFLFTGTLAALALALLVALAGLGPLLGQPLPWWPFCIMFGVAEAFIVHLSIGRETHSFSLNEVPLVLGLFLAGPVVLVLSQFVGAAVTLTVLRRQSARKVAFNLASFALSTCVAVVVFRAFVDAGDPLGIRSLMAAYIAALVADLISAVAVQSVISISSGERASASGFSVRGELYTLVNASLGLVAVLLATSRPETIWLAALLAAAMYAAYQVSVREQVRQRRLLGLHDATRGMQESLSRPTVTLRLLEQARDMLGAERAELVILPDGSGSGTRTRMVGQSVSTFTLAHDVEPFWTWLAMRSGAVHLRAGQVPADVEQGLQVEGVRELMAAPLGVGGHARAVLVVADRQGNVGPWPSDETQLLETLANHAAVALKNGELMEDLAARAAENEYQARHDALTGLPIRAWFQRLFDDATLSDRPPTAVLRIDIDGFEGINEGLGRENGDIVLRQVAARIAGVLTEGEYAARLEGAEFCAAVRGAPRSGAADDAAERILRALDRPVMVDDLPVDVSATIGVAIVGVHGSDAATLLRRADRAASTARIDRVAVAVYAPELDPQGPMRSALISELREALEADQLVVFYQARTAMDTGRITGAEALVRWMHPTRGIVPPDLFIPVVEQTRLIRPLTVSVLTAAVSRCAAWRAEGLDLVISVNLSTRNLMDALLSTDVGRILEAARLPAANLVLEVTESAVMVDAARAHAILTELRSMGVRVALDDFGTGHSSLAYLSRLPVDELKIDRSFVMHLADDPLDRSVVRSTIDLAHDLGLRVVAEGVEDQAAWAWLAGHGCDEAQGWLMGRPIPADAFEATLRDGPRAPRREPILVA